MRINALFLSILIAIAAWAQAPVGLAVKAATNKKVDLAWTGTASSYTIQRRPLGGSFSDLATVSTPSYSDTSIDAYTTYQYQIVAGSSTASNQVTAGPPPAGFTTAALAPGPAGGDAARNYGYDLSMTLDANGDPAFAFIFHDPNLDSDAADTRIEFRSWNRALYQWNDLVHVALNQGDIATAFHATISLAFDASTNTFGLAVETADEQGIALYLSADGGATWSRKTILSPSGEVSSPSLAFANGTIHLAYVERDQGLKYVTGQLSADPSTWQAKIAPAGSGVEPARQSVTISLALDSSNNPGIVWWADDSNAGYNEVLLFWKPLGGSAPIRVLDSQGEGSDQLASKLVFSGLNPRVLVFVQRADADFGVGLHTAKSDNGGATWSTPVVIPPDGNSTTDYPFDLTVDSTGKGVVAFGENGSSGDYSCGNPKISRTNDFVTFSTCDVVNDRSVTGDYSVYPEAIQARFGGNDRLYLLWWDDGGILMYREPPPSTVSSPSISSVVNGATFQAGIVPGSWATITGANLSNVTRLWQDSDFNGNILPTALGGVQVKVNNLDAPVYYISPTQINFQAPSGISGNVSVQVIRDGAAGNMVSAGAVASAPGLFTYALGGKTYPSALFNGTYTIVGDPALYASAQKVKAGDIIQLYATGLGASPAGNIISTPIPFSDPVKVFIGSTSVDAGFAGLVGVGLFQINFTVPPGLADGDYLLAIHVGSVESQAGVILPVTH